MPIFPSPVVHQKRIASALEKAVSILAPDVVRIRFSFGDDWTGDPSVFFRVVLSDSASRRDRLGELVQRVESTVFREVKPNELGLQDYYNYRSVSEQAEAKEESWE